MLVKQEYQDEIRERTQGLAVFDEEIEPEVGKEYVLAYPDFGTPDGNPDYTAHRFQVVKVLRPTNSDERDEELGPGFVVQAKDGWQGQVEPSELYPFEPLLHLDLPADLLIEVDEDGIDEASSSRIKQAVKNVLVTLPAGSDVRDMPVEFQNLAEVAPLEMSEALEEFENEPKVEPVRSSAPTP
jgi:hypothetical protein